MTDPASNRPLRIFLCHASGDKPAVRELYRRLRADGFAPWLDEEDILPGKKWQNEIPKAVRNADVVLVCLSQHAINKTGYVQKEIKFALDVADEQPEGAIFLIPLRLEQCEVPDRLSHLQWVNLYDDGGYAHLLRSLRRRGDSTDLSRPTVVSAGTSTEQPPAKRVAASEVTEDDRASLQKQLNELRRNLTLIEERKAEYVLATDVPLQLVKDERRLREQIADVEQRLSTQAFATTAQMATSVPATTGEPGVRDTRAEYMQAIIDLADEILTSANESLVENEETLIPFLLDPANRSSTREALLRLFERQKDRGSNKRWLTVIREYRSQETDPKIGDILDNLIHAVDGLFQTFYSYSSIESTMHKWKLLQKFNTADAHSDERMSDELVAACRAYLDHLRQIIEAIADCSGRLNALMWA